MGGATRAALKANHLVEEIGRVQEISVITKISEIKTVSIGSSAFIAILSEGKTAKIKEILNYINPTTDNDFIIDSQESIERLGEKLGSGYKGMNLVDIGAEHKVEMGVGKVVPEAHSPFMHYIIDQAPTIDFFVKSVGPIRFGEDELNTYATINMQDGSEKFEIRVANIPFLAATNLNPLTVTDERLKKGALLVIKAREGYASEEKFVQEVIRPIVEYIRSGEKLVAQKIYHIESDESLSERHARVLVSEEYTEYAKYAKEKTPNKIDYMRKTVLGIAKRLELGGSAANERALILLTQEMRKD